MGVAVLVIFGLNKPLIVWIIFTLNYSVGSKGEIHLRAVVAKNRAGQKVTFSDHQVS